MRRMRAFIYDRPRWPEFAWDDRALGTPLARLRHKQGRLQGRMESLAPPLRAQAQLAVLTSDIVRTSAIEGELLDPTQVRSSVARKLGLESGGLVKVGRDVEGIVEVMLDATRHFDRPLTRARLFGWQAALFPTGRSGLRRIAVGRWRPASAGPMQVVSGPVGREKVHFEAPEASQVPSEMKRYLEWFNAPASADPVLHAAVAHLWFVTVHPFEDGNGRIGRAIADMALARAEGTSERFYSMSTQIDHERQEYYRQLERTQRGGLDITGWMEWFLACLERAVDGSDRTLSGVLEKARLWQQINRRPVNDRQQRVINRMLGPFEGPLTTSKYAKLAKCSSDTALRDIQELLERRILVQNPGGGRSTSYRLGEAERVR
ncbi:MAG: Fic family protein [Phycisphaerales bacterium]